MRAIAQNAIGGAKVLFGSFGSKDKKSRKMAYVFLALFIGTVVSLIIANRKLNEIIEANRNKLIQTEKKQDALTHMLEREMQLAEGRISTLDIGRFSVDLTRGKEAPEKSPAILNMAEINIVLDCDTKETCKYIEHNIVLVRDQISNVLTGIEYDSLMSINGKREIRSNIKRALNHWLPKGKIEDVYFTSVIAG